MLNNEIIPHDLCTGCSACYASCPVSCIKMGYDKEGFIFPVKGDECINCGLCKKVCPRNNLTGTAPITFTQLAYAAKSKNKRIWRSSTSGGVFYELCRAWNRNGDTLFVGATWDGFTVKHACVQRLDEIKRFSKSKYIQSEMGDAFKDIKNWLGAGNWVVFSGTPCQVSGLKAYLGDESSRILYIDLICHGVGSNLVFRDCLKIVESQIKEKIISYSFRTKGIFFEKDHIAKLITESNKKILLSSDPYLELFVNQTCLRKSCGKNCIYRTASRQGDITIGDFKGLAQVFPSFTGSKYNYSTIVINTKKGENALELSDNAMELHRCSVEDIERYNPIFSRHTFFSKDRDEFFEKYIDNPIKAINEITNDIVYHKRSLKSIVYMLLPKYVRAQLIKRRLK